VPCQASLGVPTSFFRVAAPPGCRPFEKKPKGRSQTKKTLFVPQRRSEMILPRRPPVNFASNILDLKKTLEAKFYNGLQKKYKEQ
jgi:hypothetical protein